MKISWVGHTTNAQVQMVMQGEVFGRKRRGRRRSKGSADRTWRNETCNCDYLYYHSLFEAIYLILGEPVSLVCSLNSTNLILPRIYLLCKTDIHKILKITINKYFKIQKSSLNYKYYSKFNERKHLVLNISRKILNKYFLSYKKFLRVKHLIIKYILKSVTACG